jgi:hypothetical protein
MERTWKFREEMHMDVKMSGYNIQRGVVSCGDETYGEVTYGEVSYSTLLSLLTIETWW